MSGQFAENQKSMEDILSSIRQTIEDDMREGRRWVETTLGPAIGSVHPEKAQTPTSPGQVIELTQMLNEDGTVTNIQTQAGEIPAQAMTQPILTLVQEAPISQEAPLQTASQEEITSVSFHGENDTVSLQEASSGDPSLTFTQQEVTPMFDTTSAQKAVEDIFDAPSQEHVLQEDSPMSTAQAIDDIFAASAQGTPPHEEPSPVMNTSFQETAPVVDLISQETLAASSDALAALSDRFAPQAAAAFGTASDMGVGSKTLETLMQEMLRPMLKDWLDAHLPSLVKWIVTEQIEKVVQQRFGAQKD